MSYFVMVFFVCCTEDSLSEDLLPVRFKEMKWTVLMTL